MHSLLENYLAEVEAKLSALPTKRREEEMREMYQHLLDAVRINCEQGQTEAEAAADALAEFGTPEEASESVLWAWRRDVRKKNAQLSFDFAYMMTCLNGISLFPIKWHAYGPNCIILCGWVLTLLVAYSRFLPAKYQPSWMCWWFVPSAQQDANKT